MERRCEALEEKVQILSRAEAEAREAAEATRLALESQRRLVEASDERNRLSDAQTAELVARLEEQRRETQRLQQQSEDLRESLDDARRRAAAAAVGDLSLGATAEGLEALLKVERLALEEQLLAKDEAIRRLEDALQKTQTELLLGKDETPAGRRDEGVQTPDTETASSEGALCARLQSLEAKWKEERERRLQAEGDGRRLLFALREAERRHSAALEEAAAERQAAGAAALEAQVRGLKAEAAAVKRAYSHTLAINEKLSRRVVQLVDLLQTPAPETETSLRESVSLLRDALAFSHPQQVFACDGQASPALQQSLRSGETPLADGASTGPLRRRHSVDGLSSAPPRQPLPRSRSFSQDPQHARRSAFKDVGTASVAECVFSFEELQALVGRAKRSRPCLAQPSAQDSLREDLKVRRRPPPKYAYSRKACTWFGLAVSVRLRSDASGRCARRLEKSGGAEPARSPLREGLSSS